MASARPVRPAGRACFSAFGRLTQSDSTEASLPRFARHRGGRFQGNATKAVPEMSAMPKGRLPIDLFHLDALVLGFHDRRLVRFLNPRHAVPADTLKQPHIWHGFRVEIPPANRDFLSAER